MSYKVETTVDAFPMVPAFDPSAGFTYGGFINSDAPVDAFPDVSPFVETAPVPQVARFSANRKMLMNRLKSVSAFSPRRSPKAILQTVRLSVNGTVQMHATDCERSIVTDDNFQRDGEVSGLVNPARILAVLKGMKTPDVECDLKADKLTIRSDRAALSVPVEFPVADFPAVPDFVCDVAFVVNAADLAHSISQTIFATDTESTRYALGGILFELCDDGNLNLCATDTRRLAVHNVGTVDVLTGSATDKDTFVVPTGFLAALEPFIDSAETVEIHFRRHVCEVSKNEEGETITTEIPGMVLIRGTDRLSAGQTTFSAVSRTVEGRFPRYRDYIPGKPMANAAQAGRCQIELELDKTDFLEALKTAAVVSTEECRGLDFSLPAEAGGIFVEITGRSPETGESTARLFAVQSITGKPVSVITFDPCYIVEYLKALPKSAKTVQLAIADECSAGLLTATGERGSYVIMPLSRDR